MTWTKKEGDKICPEFQETYMFTFFLHHSGTDWAQNIFLVIQKLPMKLTSQLLSNLYYTQSLSRSSKNYKNLCNLQKVLYINLV